MTEKTCNSCIHFGACSKWTDFPKQCGVPVCASFAQQSEKYLIKENGDILPLTHHSEWISVTDRLPELETTRTDGYHRPKSIRVLCVCKQRSGKVFVKEGYYELFANKPCWRIPGSIDSVTHWMQLPEPPEMKGGAE